MDEFAEAKVDILVDIADLPDVLRGFGVAAPHRVVVGRLRGRPAPAVIAELYAADLERRARLVRA
ncbi:hypothetical protein [Nostocoides vanveenii]|uniref:Uncharacterized protein n=1 Tax=Nostocoides vanveenii TaxID=330835 RepID=A0ABN2K7U2_9MICO